MQRALLFLDGPLGTELNARGVPTPLPGWSAHALQDHPDAVGSVHRAYVEAGAEIHTTNTFRTRRRLFPEEWATLTRLAVRLARRELRSRHRLAGSLAPLEDCYQPALSPPAEIARKEHREMAQELASAGVDLLLCETFPHVDEGLIAAEEAVATGLETWLAMTAGPAGNLLTPDEIRSAGEAAVGLGVDAILVNCVPAPMVLGFLEALQGLGVPIGAYANVGVADENEGWRALPMTTRDYVKFAESWVAAGASIVGGCCGTGPKHLAALVAHLKNEENVRDI